MLDNNTDAKRCTIEVNYDREKNIHTIKTHEHTENISILKIVSPMKNAISLSNYLTDDDPATMFLYDELIKSVSNDKYEKWTY